MAQKTSNKQKRRLIFPALFVFFLVGLMVLGTMAITHYQEIKSYPVTAWSEDHRADCAIVLTGGPNRLADSFAQLYLKRVKKLIISGVHPAAQLREIFPQRFFYGNLDPGDIILEKRSLTTYGNALQALPLIEALNCKDVVLITSRLHMKRAFATFRHQFPKEIPIYQRSTLGKRFEPHWTRVLSETFKSVFYEIWFY